MYELSRLIAGDALAAPRLATCGTLETTRLHEIAKKSTNGVPYLDIVDVTYMHLLLPTIFVGAVLNFFPRGGHPPFPFKDKRKYKSLFRKTDRRSSDPKHLTDLHLCLRDKQLAKLKTNETV